MKHLTKSYDKVLFGVCGGLAEYINIDPIIIRLIWVLAVVLAKHGIILYLLAALIIPERVR